MATARARQPTGDTDDAGPVHQGELDARHPRPVAGGGWALARWSNLLFLTGPLFMLQVYERVLPARSGPTLVVLFGLVAFLYAIMAALDMARGGVMARLAARYQAVQDPKSAVRASCARRARSAGFPHQRGRCAISMRCSARWLSPRRAGAARCTLGAGFSGPAGAFVHPQLGWLALGGRAGADGAGRLSDNGGNGAAAARGLRSRRRHARRPRRRFAA